MCVLSGVNVAHVDWTPRVQRQIENAMDCAHNNYWIERHYGRNSPWMSIIDSSLSGVFRLSSDEVISLPVED